MVSNARGKAQTPLFDLGDDFTVRLPISDADRARQALRADLILQSMANMGYDGFVPGERDLAFGLDRLRAASQKLKLPILSANLTPVAGESPFVGRLEVKAGDLNLCLVAANGAGDYGPEVILGDPIPATAEQLARLSVRPCDLRILLAHMDRAELDKLIGAVPGFDAAILGHQGQQFQPQQSGTVTVFGDGAKGRQVGRIALGIAAGATAGPLQDRGEADRLRDGEKLLQHQIDELEKRIATVPPSLKANSQRSLETLQSRLKEMQARASGAEHQSAPRVFSFDWINLGTDVADAPSVKADLDAFERDHPEPSPTPSVARPPGMAGSSLRRDQALDGGWKR